MGKSRAEISRDYRRRLKERDNAGYLRKERARRKRNYVPTVLLNSTEKAVRRRKNREAVRKFRAKNILQNQHAEQVMDSSGYDSSGFSSDHRDRLVVSMRFPGRAAGPKTRLSRELSSARKAINKLKAANVELARRLKTEQRKKQRIVKRLQNRALTPRSKAESLMRKAGLTKTQRNSVRKEIVFGNVVAEQLMEKKKELHKGTVGGLHMIVAGQIMKKYRSSTALCNKAGLNRCTFYKYMAHKTNKADERRSRKCEIMIVDFLERDDNSRCQPGKGDSVKCSGEVKQTRVLTDYLQNLHMKFLA